MSNFQTFQRFAGVAALLSAPLAWGSLAVGLSGVDYDFDVFSDANLLIQAGGDAANLIRWSLFMNMFGNYLLLIPLAIFLWFWLRANNPFSTSFYSMAGLIYILFGALGAAILSATWPKLIADYAQASAAQQETLTIVFKAVTGIAQDGIQGAVQNIPAAIWFCGVGQLLLSKRRWMGYFTIVLGLFLLLNGLGAMLNIELLSLIGLTANVLLAPLWALLMGIILLRYPVDLSDAD